MPRLKRLYNTDEYATVQGLKVICEKFGAAVNAKVRLADVFEIQASGIDHALYHFALTSHFDFLVTDNNSDPLFAVEFDGPSHATAKAQARDANKFKLCRHFEFPILRISSQYLTKTYRHYDLLGWCVDSWFTVNSLNDAQATGFIPIDEPIAPTMVVCREESEPLFPLWLCIEPLSKIQGMWRDGLCAWPIPCQLIGRDTTGHYHGLMWMMIDEDHFAMVESAARCQFFTGLIPSELLTEVLTFEIHEQLAAIISGQIPAVSIRKLEQRLGIYESNFQLAQSSLWSNPSKSPPTKWPKSFSFGFLKDV